MPRTIIFANGELHNLHNVRKFLRTDDVIIAADGGARYCHALGVTPQVLIGDLDSVLPHEVEQLQHAGTRILKYPTHKDETDLELALDLAIQENASEIVIFGALGGRWDQTLANLLLPALDKFTAVSIRLIDGDQEIALIRSGASLRWHGHAGATVSLIPLSGEARGVTTRGLEYALHEGTLKLGSTLGVSNVMTGEEAEAAVTEGVVCVIISR